MMNRISQAGGWILGETSLKAAIGLVGLAALARMLPHPWNVTPVAAMALFGGVVLGRPLFAIGVPLAALALSDLAVNSWMQGNPLAPPDPWVYGSFLLIGIIGCLLRSRRNVGVLAAASLAGSGLFFLLTNFGVWAGGLLYPRTLQGLVACYAAAVPFLARTLLGDLFWNAVLFGSYLAAVRWSASRREVLRA
ncbi:MAG: DUF6580 family putative transport protein [Acidobacteriota bacterium]